MSTRTRFMPDPRRSCVAWDHLAATSLTALDFPRPPGPPRIGSPECREGGVGAGGSKQYCRCSRCWPPAPYVPDNRPFGPSREGSTRCRSGSIASGGERAFCTCDTCF